MFGALNLSQGSAVTGILPTQLGGTGVNSGAVFPTTGTVVTRSATETLSNKTLLTPVISAISNTGMLILPTTNDTLVGRATSDTLTNKTLSNPVVTSATINGSTLITGATAISTTGSINAGPTSVTGDLSVRGNNSTANKLVFITIF